MYRNLLERPVYSHPARSVALIWLLASGVGFLPGAAPPALGATITVTTPDDASGRRQSSRAQKTNGFLVLGHRRR